MTEGERIVSWAECRTSNGGARRSGDRRGAPATCRTRRSRPSGLAYLEGGGRITRLAT